MKTGGFNYASGEPSVLVSELEHTISKGRQSTTAFWLLKLNEFKVKIQIKKDTYDFQSYAQGYVWSPTDLQWNLVYSIPFAMMKTLTSTYLDDGLALRHFKADYDTVVDNLKKVLF